jgi:iron complex transport system ATP-binding protein
METTGSINGGTEAQWPRAGELPSPAAIELRRLVVHAGGCCVLDVEHLCIEKRGVVALMGPNGAGKTTLLQTCLGLTKPTQGEAAVLGENVRNLSGASLARLRRRIGYVPQLLPQRCELPLTVCEVVAIGRTARVGLFRRLAQDDWRIVEHWIERLGLAPVAGRAFSMISGGEQRKTIIARAMAQEPELLLLDEPTANLDLGWRERIVETVENLCVQTRLSVVLVCHELEVLPPACRQVVLLESGRVAAVGTPQEVFTSERVRSLYGAGLRALHEGGRHAIVPDAGGDA